MEKKIGTREWYSFIARLGTAIPGLHLGGEAATRRLFELAPVAPNSRVLDIGCGSGYSACLLAEQFPVQVVGIDISPEMIAQAEKRASAQGLSDRVSFRTSDARSLPFDSGEFGGVLVESVLTPLEGDKADALGEIRRVLSPGGWLAVNESTINSEAPEDYLDLLDEHPAIHGYFTPASLEELVSAAGFEVVVQEVTARVDAPDAVSQLGFGGLVKFMLTVYPRILYKLLTDARFRYATTIDGLITKRGQEYMGYSLLVARKPAG